MVRPSRGADDVNLCVNCHDPHGVRDENGVIPAMLTDRESDLCLECHDGSAGADVRTSLLKPYKHGARAVGRHQPHEADDPDVASAAFGGSRRHVACSDCHNIHAGARDRMRPLPPEVPKAISGVARVEVVNGLAGAIPAYRFRTADDATPASEYEVCFKCHSSWTSLPAGRPDLARLTNPQNPSFHPIQARGRDSRIAPESFTANWAADSLVYCVDCHGSDDPGEAGLHASTYPYLLRRPYPTSPDSQPSSRNDLCFDCHAYDVYADSSSSDLVQGASRFNASAGPGHAFHVGTQSIPCFTCHDSHGSVSYGSLIAVGRAPGLMSFVQTPFGGTCTSTCHGARSYKVNYPR